MHLHISNINRRFKSKAPVTFDLYLRCIGRKACASLRALLSQIMLRRTQADILKKLLPPRTDVIVYCGLTPCQDRGYEAAAAAMCRSLGLSKNEHRYVYVYICISIF